MSRPSRSFFNKILPFNEKNQFDKSAPEDRYFLVNFFLRLHLLPSMSTFLPPRLKSSPARGCPSTTGQSTAEASAASSPLLDGDAHGGNLGGLEYQILKCNRHRDHLRLQFISTRKNYIKLSSYSMKLSRFWFPRWGLSRSRLLP